MRQVCITSIMCGFFLFCPKGYAADWVYFAKDNAGNYKFYDRTSISYLSQGTVTVWKKDVYSRQGIEDYVAQRAKNNLSTFGYSELSHVVCKEELNCKTREYRVLACTMYDKSGSVLEKQSASNGHQAWEPTIPGSENDAFGKLICTLSPKKIKKKK
ncbi:MAG TPA: hypothetical protein PLN83_07230 [Syntrophorhabdus sp.]|nr:hypothetical protein [Syntrophorhabdus sp.]